MNNRHYCIIESKDVKYIDWTTVNETGPETLRYNNDKSKTFVKYEGDQPEFLFCLTGDLVGLPEYTHEQFIEILEGPEWTAQD